MPVTRALLSEVKKSPDASCIGSSVIFQMWTEVLEFTLMDLNNGKVVLLRIRIFAMRFKRQI